MIKLLYDEKCAEDTKIKYDQIFQRKIEQETNTKKVTQETIVGILRVVFSLILSILLIFKIKMEVDNNRSDGEINFWCIFLILSVSSFLMFIFLILNNIFGRKTMLHDYKCKVNEFEYPVIVDFYLRTKDKNILELSVERNKQFNNKPVLCATVEKEDGLVEHMFFELKESKHSTKISEIEVDLGKGIVTFPYKKDKINFKVQNNEEMEY